MLSRSLLLATTNTESSTWTPEQIATELWLDFADSGTIAKSGTEITLVTDKSGNLRTFTPGSFRPNHGTQTINTLPVAVFSGSEFLQSQQSASTWRFLNDSTGSTCFFVFNSYTGYLLATGDSNAGILFFMDKNSVGLFVTGNNLISVENGITTPLSGTQLLGSIANPSASPVVNRSTLQLNAGTGVSNNVRTGTPANQDPNATLYINGVAGTPLASGLLAEIILISGIASLENRQKIEGYLAHKWGLTTNLPSDHPYKSVAP